MPWTEKDTSISTNKNVKSEKRKHHIRHQHHHQHHNPHVNSESSPLVFGETLTNSTGKHQDKNCTHCKIRERNISLTKEVIKLQILNKLGLTQPPNISRNSLPIIPPLHYLGLLDTYGVQSDSPIEPFKPGPVYEDVEDDYHAKTEKIITFAQEPPEHLKLLVGHNVHFFRFSPSTMSNKVVRAQLWLHLIPSMIAQSPSISIILNRIVPPLESDRIPEVRHLYTTMMEWKPRQGGWVHIDIRKLVSDWFRNPRDNHGLTIDIIDSDGNSIETTKYNTEDKSTIPFLEIKTADDTKRRTKRMVGLNCEESSTEVRCCRYPLIVDFEEFGWDWIIAPKRYEANYCSGECPFVFLQKYPHTHLVQHASPAGSAGPCCTPRKMSAISMLYFDEHHTIIYGLLPGMVVDKCGCS